MAQNYYLIGNAHLDPIWQWRVAEGLSLIRSTFRSALDRMNENKDYKFTSACAGYYFWIKNIDPDMFSEIKQRVAEGRWGIVGGMWVQPDCNIPSGESFCRHLLYSQKFFKENFGNITNTGYNVDSFGHSAALPQLLKKSGIDNYVYMRPSRETENPDLPNENLHKWVSPDGSEVIAFRIYNEYCGDLSYAGDYDSYNKLADYLDSFQTPWTCCFGNHDNQDGDDSVKPVVDNFLNHKYFVFEKCDSELGNSNLVLLIQKNGKNAEGIILMDTHDRVPYKENSCGKNLLGQS